MDLFRKKIIIISLLCTNYSSYAIPLDSNLLEKPTDNFISNNMNYLTQNQYNQIEPTLLLKKINPIDKSVVQGLAVNKKYLYTMHLVGKPEKAIITQYKYTNKYSIYPIKEQIATNFIGHQGITIDPNTNMLWATAGDNIKNKGWYIVGFKFNNSKLLEAPLVKQVFDENYKNYTPSMPSISPNSKYLVVAGHNIKNNTSVIRVFDFSTFLKSNIPIQPLYEWNIDNNFLKDHYFFQALTTDGNYIYLFSGGENNLNKRIYVYDLKGNQIQKLENINIGKPQFLDKNNPRWEPEGLAIDSKTRSLLIMYAVGNNQENYTELFKIPIQ